MKYIIDKQYAIEEKFFKEIIADITKSYQINGKDIGLVIVAHILIDAIPFLEALSSIFSIDVVFAKPKSINQRVMDYLSAKFKIVIADREKIDDISYVSSFINKKHDGFILIDIGGYFSSVSNELKDEFGKKFLGSIEDTENGFLKYISNEVRYPFYQVARSPLKTNEDYLVGQAISFSAESIFREHGILLNGQKVGVIGYGKIGGGVANALKARQSIVFVNDIDPVKVIHSYSHGFIPQDKESLLKDADIICLASGNSSLVTSDIPMIKSGAYVFTVTSSDNEIDMKWLKENYLSSEISPMVTKYYKGNHFFYIINDGNAINFIHGTTVSTFILLVQAELISCALALVSHAVIDSTYSIENKIRQKIAQIWLKLFASKYNHVK